MRRSLLIAGAIFASASLAWAQDRPAATPTDTPQAPGAHAGAPMGQGSTGATMGCQAMMQQRHLVMAEQRASDERLKQLVAQMNRIGGPEKVDAMAVVINAMVDQRIAQRERMQQMQERMMAHMMGHMQGGMQGGTADRMACPMMKEMMGGPGGTGTSGEPAAPVAPSTGAESGDHAQHQ